MADSIQDYAVNSARWLSLEDFEGEVWKDIPGYKGWYQVSNFGRIKSVDRQFMLQRVCDSVPRIITCKACIIKACTKRGDYLTCHLKKNGTNKSVKFHQVVCKAFHPNPDGLPEVNHINEIKTDNRADNLEWCTRRYNATWGTAIERGVRKRISLISRKVYQYDLEGKFISAYPSIREAARVVGAKEANIASVCNNGKSSTAAGFIWSFTQNEADIAQKISRKRANKSVYEERSVAMCDLNGNFLRRFSSIAQASYYTGAYKDTISRCCKHEGYYKTAGGYKWEYAD